MRILFPVSLISLLISFLLLLGIEINAFEKFWWYSPLLHSFGGVWVAGMFVWFFYTFSIPLPSQSIIEQTLLFVLFVGVSWEIMEYFVLVHPEGYVLDTISDLIMDFCGASYFLWVLFFRRII